MPQGSILEVEDTTAALGFHLPIFLSNISTQQVTEGLFVSMGIFHIPVPDARHAELWDSAILNSTRFILGLKLHGETTVEVNVHW